MSPRHDDQGERVVAGRRLVQAVGGIVVGRAHGRPEDAVGSGRLVARVGV